jgi:hypothetical protein
MTLNTAGAELVAFDPDWRTQLLSVIASPSLALVLMMLGIYGLLFEFSNPGFVLPGVVGGFCLLLALKWNWSCRPPMIRGLPNTSPNADPGCTISAWKWMISMG